MFRIIYILVLLGLSQYSYAQGRIFDILTLGKEQKESFEYQHKILKKWKISDDYLFQFHPEMIDSMIESIDYHLDLWDLEYGSGFSPMQFRVFDNKGDLVTAWTYCYLSFNKHGILDEPIKTIDYEFLNRNLKLKNTIKLIENNEALTSELIAEYDYIIVAFWASYYGSGVRKMLQYIQKYVDNTDKKVLFLKVNYNGEDA